MKKLTNKKRFFTASIATLLLLGASTAGFVSCKNETETKYIPLSSGTSTTAASFATEFSLRRCYALDNTNLNVIFFMDKKLWNV